MLRRGCPRFALPQLQQQRWLHASPVALKGRRTGSKAHYKNFKKPYRRKPPKKGSYMRKKEHNPPLWRDGEPYKSITEILKERKMMTKAEREERSANAYKELFCNPSFLEFEKKMDAILEGKGFEALPAEFQESSQLPDPSDTSLPARIGRVLLTPAAEPKQAYMEARMLWRFAENEPTLADDLNKPETWLALLKAASRARAFDDCVAIADAAFDALPEEFNDNVDGCSSDLIREVVRVAVDTKRIASALTTFEGGKALKLCDVDPEYGVLLVRCYAEQRLPERALNFVDEMRVKDIARTPQLYAALFNAVATAPQWHRTYSRLVDDVLDEMQGDLVAPSPAVYDALIKTAGRCGDARSALHWFDEMKSRHGMVRSDRVYTTLFAALASAQSVGQKNGTKRRALFLPPWIKLGIDPLQATIEGHNIDRHVFEQYVKEKDVVVEQTAMVRKKDISTRKLMRRPLSFEKLDDYEKQMATEVVRDYDKEGAQEYLDEQSRRQEIGQGDPLVAIGDGSEHEAAAAAYAASKKDTRTKEEIAEAALDKMAREIAAMEMEEGEEDEEDDEEDVIVGQGYKAPETEEDRMLQEFLNDSEGKSEMSKLLDKLETKPSSGRRTVQDDEDLPQMLTPEQLKELREKTREIQESPEIQELVEQHEQEVKGKVGEDDEDGEMSDELVAMLQGREDELDLDPGPDRSFEDALGEAGKFPTPGFEEEEDDELTDFHPEVQDEEQLAVEPVGDVAALPSLRSNLLVEGNEPWGEVTRLRELGNDWDILDRSTEAIHKRQETNIAIAKMLFEGIDFVPSAATLNAYFSVYTEGMRRKRARQVAEELAAKYPGQFPDSRTNRHLTKMLTRRGELQSALAGVSEDEEDMEILGSLLEAASKKGQLELAHKLAEKLIAAQKKRNLSGLGASDALPKYPKIVRLGVVWANKDKDKKPQHRGVPERLLRSYRQLCRTRNVEQPSELRADPILVRQKKADFRRRKGDNHEARKAKAKERSKRRQFEPRRI